MDPRSKPVPRGWHKPIEDWAAAMAAAGLSSETIATRTDHMRRIARAMHTPPGNVTPDQLIKWAAAQKWARDTRRSIYASARGFWTWATKTGISATSPALDLPKVRASEPAPRPIPQPIADQAIRISSRRTALILRCAIDVAMRRTEICKIHITDLEPDGQGWSMVVHGKGGRQRVVPLPDDLALDLRAACLAGGGWAFPGRIDGHLSPRRVGELATEVLPGVWTLHTLRHACATRVHDKTGDLLVVRELLGHVSVATTQRYVQTSKDRLRSALELSARTAA